MSLLRIIAIAAVFALASAPARTEQAADVIALSGVGTQLISLTPATLAKLPPVEMDVTFNTSKGPSSGHYKGVLLWDVLASEKAFEGLEHNAELAKTLLVTGRDGYRIVFSVGEIHPDFGKTAIIVATEVDGKALAEGLRIIVPGDTRGARNVRDVTKVELR